jgi:hypothetical protein
LDFLNFRGQAFEQGRVLDGAFDQRLAIEELTLGAQGLAAFGDDAEAQVAVGFSADAPGIEVDAAGEGSCV